jgi:cation diffusion facilitator CzcD-associated flavoprotein CzcO
MNQHVIIVGAGFAGLGMAIRLKRAGIEDFTILEQAERVGGTWRDNHYPGAACDIESHLYSYSFEPYSGWSRTFAPQSEILAYLERCVEKDGLKPHLRLGEGVRSARYDEASATWRVETTRGECLRARILISGCGPLTRPALPELPGLNQFAGRSFHSARWDDTYPLECKRVAVIGTGASAIQIVPQIAPRVAQLHVFQRTPPWILPKFDHPYPEERRLQLQRSPWRQALSRQSFFWRHELSTLAFVRGRSSRLLRFGEFMARRHLFQSVKSPELRAQLLPSYSMGCKRVLLSNDYYPALTRPNVELVTQPIESVQPHGVRTLDGRERPVDALILATGFQAAEAVAPFEVRGKGGLDLDAAWSGGAEAYLGTAIAGFPNLFLLIGPNTGLGSSSMILMIEAQLAYVLDCIQTMRGRGLGSVEVRADAQRRFNQRLQGQLGNTVWASGCKAWYTTRSGRNTTLWPGATLEFRWRTRPFDLGAYHAAPAAADAAGREHRASPDLASPELCSG